MRLPLSLVPILLALITIALKKNEWILIKMWKSDGNLHPGQSQVKNIHFYFLFCKSENKPSVKAPMQCL